MVLFNRLSTCLFALSLLGVWGCAEKAASELVTFDATHPHPVAPAPAPLIKAVPPAEAGAMGGGMMGGMAADAETAELAAGVDTSKPSAERILIYSATLRMAVAEIEPALEAAQKTAGEVGGYMEALTSESITIRVPAREFFPVLDQLKKIGQVLARSVLAQDVTDEYVDLQLRLKNAEALRDRFLAILEKAKTVKETLEVEKELGRIREEIERIKGRLAVMDKQIAFSRIDINFVQASEKAVTAYRPESPFPWLDELGVEKVLRIQQD